MTILAHLFVLVAVEVLVVTEVEVVPLFLVCLPGILNLWILEWELRQGEEMMILVCMLFMTVQDLYWIITRS